MPRTATNPCFNGSTYRDSSVLHLPVAPRANSKLRFSSAPAAIQALTPIDALACLQETLEQNPLPSMIGITGPGDPLATPDTTLLTLEMVRERYPSIPLCLTTNGIGGEEVAKELAGIGLSHITIQIDAVRPEVAEKLYLWVRPGTKTVPLPAACRVLMEEQTRSIKAFKREGLTVKVNTTIFAGLNAGHVEEIAKHVAVLGADIMNVVPCSASDNGSDNDNDTHCPPGLEIMTMVRDRAARHIKLMPPMEQCGETSVALTVTGSTALFPGAPAFSASRPNVAVVSSTGMDVDMHLGHADRFLIYGRAQGPEAGLIQLLETRPAPEPGNGDSRWESGAKVLHDCFTLLATSAGPRPQEIFAELGIKVLLTDGNIEGTVEALYGEGKKGKKNKATC